MEYKNIMKTILITGATSFIGQNLIRYLINDYKIIAVMRVNSPKINSLPNHKNLSVIQLNMDSYNTLSKILNIKNLYSFIHLSWGVHAELIEIMNKCKKKIIKILFLH